MLHFCEGNKFTRQSFGPLTMNIKQPLLLATWSKMNTIGHCIGIVQNMIVDATLMDDIALSCDSLDVVLGETVTDITWCQSYYPSSDKV